MNPNTLRALHCILNVPFARSALRLSVVTIVCLQVIAGQGSFGSRRLQRKIDPSCQQREQLPSCCLTNSLRASRVF